MNHADDAETQLTLSCITAVRRYCQELELMGVKCERVLLFGSQAVGQVEEGSDIDLIIISSTWGPYSTRERLEMLGLAAARILEPVQALGATPEEVSTHRISPFMEHILNEQAVEIL